MYEDPDGAVIVQCARGKGMAVEYCSGCVVPEEICDNCEIGNNKKERNKSIDIGVYT